MALQFGGDFLKSVWGVNTGAMQSFLSDARLFFGLHVHDTFSWAKGGLPLITIVFLSGECPPEMLPCICNIDYPCIQNKIINNYNI